MKFYHFRSQEKMFCDLANPESGCVRSLFTGFRLSNHYMHIVTSGGFLPPGKHSIIKPSMLA